MSSPVPDHQHLFHFSTDHGFFLTDINLKALALQFPSCQSVRRICIPASSSSLSVTIISIACIMYHGMSLHICSNTTSITMINSRGLMQDPCTPTMILNFPVSPETMIRPMLTYGAEAWTVTRREVRATGENRIENDPVDTCSLTSGVQRGCGRCDGPG